jgi:hypothetical protein
MSSSERVMMWGLLAGYSVVASAGFLATIALLGAF